MVEKSCRNSEAVSAVIGVVLMLSITVLLAAVVAALVFSMSGNIARPHAVGISVKKIASGDIMILNLGSADETPLKAVTVSYQPAAHTSPILFASESTAMNDVGAALVIPASVSPTPTSPTHVTVIGHFVDNQTQILCETDV